MPRKAVNLNADPMVNNVGSIERGQKPGMRPMGKLANIAPTEAPSMMSVLEEMEQPEALVARPTMEAVNKPPKRVDGSIDLRKVPSMMSMMNEIYGGPSKQQNLDPENLVDEQDTTPITNINDDDEENEVNLYDLPGIVEKGDKVYLKVVEMFGDELFDMDNAIYLSKIIKKYLIQKKIVQVDFTDVLRIHSYFFVASLSKFISIYKENTSQKIKVKGLDAKHLKILNIVATNSIKIGARVSKGIYDIPVEVS